MIKDADDLEIAAFVLGCNAWYNNLSDATKTNIRCSLPSSTLKDWFDRGLSSAMVVRR